MEQSTTQHNGSKVNSDFMNQYNRELADAKGDEDVEMEISSPTLNSDETEINITEDHIRECEAKNKKAFKRHLDMATLERPGICNIFPKEEYKFVQSEEYVEEQERQHQLWLLVDVLYKLERGIATGSDSVPEYDEKYVKFHYLKADQLHKYSSMNEDDYLKQQKRFPTKFNVLSKDGEGMTYKMWKTNARLIRSILDLHSFRQIGGFECSILWTNTVGKRNMFEGFNDYQWINHFPSSFEITRKMDLFKNFAIMRKKHGRKEYNYLPDTFLLPEEADQFKERVKELKDAKNPNEDDPLWIVKPNKLSRGRGIYLIKDFESLNSTEPGVVSQYVDNPLCVNGHKFDLRVYVVVTSFYPLRIYVYREGLARFATERYSKNAAENNLYVHLTNYSINKKNQNIKQLKNLADDTLPFKWSLTAFFYRLAQCGIDVDLIWEQIYDIIIKSILSSEKYISYYTKDHFKTVNKSFEIFGYDIMIDQNLKPWVMEINLSPSLSLESNMDIKLKTKLVTEMFNMYGFRKLSTATDLTHDDSEEDEGDEPIASNDSTVKKLNNRNLKFIEPELTEEQMEQVIQCLQDNPDLTDDQKERLVQLAQSPHKAAILETLSEYCRKEDYIRIFPSKGTDQYFKFFHYDLEVNHAVYSFLYGTQ